MFAFFDGDDIGPKLEILLIENKLQEASLFSESINIAMKEIESFLIKTKNIRVHILGGDDVLVEYDQSVDENFLVSEINNIFKARTGCTMSCGIGENLNQAIWNLHKAKLFGKDNVYGRQ